MSTRASFSPSKTPDSLSKNTWVRTMAGVQMKLFGCFLVALCLFVPLISAKATDVKYCGLFYFLLPPIWIIAHSRTSISWLISFTSVSLLILWSVHWFWIPDLILLFVVFCALWFFRLGFLDGWSDFCFFCRFPLNWYSTGDQEVMIMSWVIIYCEFRLT